ncbi:hypothetical protein IW262DRAFT_506043 [Armillaria fumosa]|nr:hypothetical protein IW262DRAFT_506043 [Armillaria fumosa]
MAHGRQMVSSADVIFFLATGLLFARHLYCFGQMEMVCGTLSRMHRAQEWVTVNGSSFLAINSFRLTSLEVGLLFEFPSLRSKNHNEILFTIGCAFGLRACHILLLSSHAPASPIFDTFQPAGSVASLLCRQE